MTKYNLINDNNEYTGFSSIKMSNTTEKQIKPVEETETVLWNGKDWEYIFKDYEKKDVILPKFNYESALNIWTMLSSTIIPTCGTKTISHEKEISVLIPCYKKAKYIHSTVDSCINQSLKPKEVIILLMDSESQKLKKELENIDSCITCINEKQMNASKARTHLVSLCKTNWFVFLDADDNLTIDFIEKLNKDTGAICFPKMTHVKDGETKDVTRGGTLHSRHPVRALANNLTSLMCKEVFNSIGLDEDLCKGGEDSDFILSLFEKKEYLITYNPDVFFYYKENTESSLASSDEFAESIFRMLKKHTSFFVNEIENTSVGVGMRSNLIWIMKNYSLENIFTVLHSMSKKSCNSKYNYITILEKSLYNQYYELLEKSKLKKAKTSYSENDFIILGDINVMPFMFYGKTFDCIFFKCNDMSDIKTALLENKNMIINKDVYKEVQGKNLSGMNMVFYLLENYSCFEQYANQSVKIQDVEESDYNEALDKLEVSDELSKVYNIYKKALDTEYFDMFTVMKPEKQRVSFNLHSVCNKNCPYCISKTRQTKISDDEMFNNFDKALTKIEELTNKNLYIQIVGGEPCIWSDYFVNKIIDRLKDYREYLVFSNGTNKNSPFYKDTRCTVMYHVTDWEGKTFTDIKPLSQEILTVVVSHNELERFDTFMSTYDGYSSLSVQKCFSDNPSYNLSDKDCETLYEILKKYNYNGTFYNNYEYYKNNGLEKSQKVCRESRGIWQVDCSTLKVSPCCSNHETYDLADFTVGKTIKNCGDCFCKVNTIY